MFDCRDFSILIPEDPKVGVGAVIWSMRQSVSSSIVYKTRYVLFRICYDLGTLTRGSSTEVKK